MMRKYRLKITGKHPNQFLKFLYRLHIPLLEVQVEENACYVLVDEAGYQAILKIKTSYQVAVVERFGTARLSFFLSKYALFLGVLLGGYFLLMGLTHVIFDVEVIHSKEEIRTLLLNELEDRGLAKLHLKVSYDRKEKIVKEILEKYPDKLEWMEIDSVGTKYVVKVEERKLNEKQEEYKEQNIVAKKDGVIMQIEAQSGEVVKRRNDYVKKGDVLITGVIKNQETLMKKVQAKGHVIAETWYRSEVEMPLQYKESFLTGEEKKVLQISFLGHQFNLFDFHPFQHAKDHKTFLLSNPLIPFSIQWNKQQELRVIDEIYTRDEAVTKAMELAKEKLEARLSDKDEIISQKTLKITENNSKIVVEVFFKVAEDITDTAPIPQEEAQPSEE